MVTKQTLTKQIARLVLGELSDTAVTAATNFFHDTSGSHTQWVSRKAAATNGYAYASMFWP